MLEVVGDHDVVAEVHITGLASALGMMALRRGDAPAARRWFTLEAGSTDRGGETWVAGPALVGLGVSLARLGRRDEAAVAIERAIAVARRLEMPHVLADALDAQADLAVADDELRSAIAAITLSPLRPSDDGSPR